MNRNSEMEKIYMQQLRDMESAVYFLTAKKGQYERDIYNLRLPFRDPEDPPKPIFKIQELLSSTLIVLTFMCTEVCMAGIWISDVFRSNPHLTRSIFEKYPFITYSLLFFHIPFIATIIACTIRAIIYVKDYNRRKADYRSKMNKNEIVQQNNQKIYEINCSTADQKSTELATINSELQKAQNILADAYDINWIPSRYRNIRVVYYITDMVTTSAINIDEALKYYLLQEANNKLDEILQKLDEIIENQNEIICQQAIAQSKNEALIAQNKTMISQFANIEANTKLSADYSAIGANYSAATAYFSLATYLKN